MYLFIFCKGQRASIILLFGYVYFGYEKYFLWSVYHEVIKTMTVLSLFWLCLKYCESLLWDQYHVLNQIVAWVYHYEIKLKCSFISNHTFTDTSIGLVLSFCARPLPVKSF